MGCATRRFVVVSVESGHLPTAGGRNTVFDRVVLWSHWFTFYLLIFHKDVSQRGSSHSSSNGRLYALFLVVLNQHHIPETVSMGGIS